MRLSEVPPCAERREYKCSRAARGGRALGVGAGPLVGGLLRSRSRVTERSEGAQGNVRGQPGPEPSPAASWHEGGPASAERALRAVSRGLRGRTLRRRVAEHPRRGHSLESRSTDVYFRVR